MLPLAQLLTRPSSSFKASVNAGVAGHSAVIGLQCTGRRVTTPASPWQTEAPDFIKADRNLHQERLEIEFKVPAAGMLGLPGTKQLTRGQPEMESRNYICRIAQGYE